MIIVDNVSKIYRTHQGPNVVLDGVSFTITRGEKIGILGKNGSGKSTLIRLLGGAELPTKGLVTRSMSVSWPLAFAGAFQYTLTGLDNLRFICRIYGVDAASKVDYVQQFSELGRYLKEPVKTYSAGMRARLAFAISMAVEFDCFLIDEIVAVGDSRFHEKCHTELFEKRKDRAMVLVSHRAEYIREHCDRAAVLVNGKYCAFDKVDDAFDFYNANTV